MGDGNGVAVGVSPGCNVAVGVGTAVGTGVGCGVSPGASVAVGSGAAVGSGTGVGSAPPQAAATIAITSSRGMKSMGLKHHLYDIATPKPFSRSFP